MSKDDFLKKNATRYSATRCAIRSALMCNQISTALRKVTSNRLTNRIMNKNYKSAVQQFIAQNKAFSLMKPIQVTLAYWEKFSYTRLL